MLIKLTSNIPLTRNFPHVILSLPPLKKKMQKLFKQVKRQEQLKRWRKLAPKIVAAAFLFILIFYATIMSVEAFRATFLNYVLEHFEDHTKITVIPNEHSLNLALPTYIPEGFTNEVMEIHGDYYLAAYKAENHRKIFIRQLGKDSMAGIDTEDAKHESLILNGQKADCYEKENIITLVFKYEGKIFIVNGIDLPKAELIKIAENLQWQR